MTQTRLVLSLSATAGFALAVLPLVVTPGASFTLVSARGLVGDRRGAWAVIAGTGLGIVTHGLLAGAGLAVVVMRSAEAYRVVRLVGAVYLLALGLWLVWRSRGGRDTSGRLSGEGDVGVGAVVGQLWRAYVANVLNVKAASVYLSLAPQFIPSAQIGVDSMLVLAGVHVLVMVVWLGLWSAGLTTAARHLDPRRWVRWINGVGGAVLSGMGIRSVVEAR